MDEQTRRNWLVTIGTTATALGIARTGLSKPDAFLPPGVYQPSTDHLSHALMSSGKYHAITPGCPTDYVLPSSGSSKLLLFSADEFQLIRRLTELLLGEESNDTHSVSLEVAEWIDLRVASSDGVRDAMARLDPAYRKVAAAYFGPSHEDHSTTGDPRKICREGFEWLSSAAGAKYAKNFLLLEQDQQIALLRSVSDERAHRQSENAGTRLFDFLKSEIIKGFYTSQVGLKELDYKGNAFYARSPGCSK
jgi:Gluconate 2-dehydrogenase subunit 3